MTERHSQEERFQTRPATWADVPAIVRLRNASAQDTRGADVTAEHWQRRQYYDSGINLGTDTLLVLEGDRCVGYAEVASDGPNVIHEMFGAVDPAYRGLGIGTMLVQWAESHVSDTLSKAPKGVAVFIHNRVFESNQPGRELLESQGYVVAQELIYLETRIDGKPPEPDVPEGIEIRPLQSSDWAKIGPALDEAFQDHWGSLDYEDETEEDDDDGVNPRETDPEAFNETYWNTPAFSFVAWDGDEVAGACLCNEKTIEFPGSGYLGSLSIRRPWRRRGLGRTLILTSFNAFYESGIHHVVTDTDGNSLTGSYRVYQNAGMTYFRSEFIFEKAIRDGRDILIRSLPAAE